MSEEATPEAALGGNGQDLDFSAVSAEEFATLISNASDEQLAEVMSGPNRDVALREIFNRMTEHLDPARARGHDAVVHFEIGGRPDGGQDQFEVAINDGKCAVSETLDSEPRVKLNIEAVAFLKLVSARASGPELFMTGKLKIEGDLMYAPQIATLFRIPTATQQKESH
jgi:putative sterol carrier protein